MGQHEIQERRDNTELRAFMRALLEDVRALERMIETGAIETGVRRIGAEQEIFLIDGGLRPVNAALRVLEQIAPEEREAFTTELGQFNLEINLDPRRLATDCLSAMESELESRLERARAAAQACDVGLVLTGILPTLEKGDLGLDAMTPLPRYYQLNQIMRELRGGEFRTLIKGLDELNTTHDNVMLEACNTSFQVHFQVGPNEFAKLYNLAQMVTAPVLAAAVNSPVLLRHRLWHETRVALFQQSIDTRSETHVRRGGRSRVSFGDDWVDDSVLEIFRDDIARFRVLISSELDGSPLEMLDRGEVPPLTALRLHNGTVYRWNRPCYGVAGGRAHLRIENRVLPAGPSVPDEIANAAFFFGLMSSLADEFEDVRRVTAFNDVKENFMAAARYGLNARLRWANGRTYGVNDLILDHLLPAARQGLVGQGLDEADVERYLGIIQRRVETGRTGAQWMLDSITALSGQEMRPDECYRTLTAEIVAGQASGKPVAEWELARPTGAADVRESYRTVGQIMKTDLFTTHPEDLIDLAANVMDWEHIRHVPVEDEGGRLVGMVTYRQLLRMVARGRREDGKPVAVHEIMRPNPVTVTPQTSTLEAVATMRDCKVGCLPVVEDGKLVGIVTESDFIDVSAQLLDSWLRGE